MSSRIDQLVFGYRDGHELLAASTEIGPRLEAELLPHADARFEGDSEHYLVGIGIEELDRFMLARIWPAPEMPRPGAVWTHALLLDQRALRDADPLTLVKRLRRPSLERLAAYESPLEIDSDAERRTFVDVPEPLMSALCLFAYAPPQRNAVVIWRGTEDSEAGLLALWRRLPAGLRGQFSFRTRGRARTGRSPYLLQIASELAGRSPSEEVALIDPREQPEVAWARALARASRDPHDALAAALDEVAVGRADSVLLARAWPLIEREDAPALIASLGAVDSEPDQLEGVTRALFGPPEVGHRLWRLSETERIAALLELDQFAGAGQLLAADRLEAAWDSERQAMLDLFARRATLGSAGEHKLVTSALHSLSDRELLMRADDAQLLHGIVAERPQLLSGGQFWSRLSAINNEELVRQAITRAPGDLVRPLVEAEAWSILVRAIELGEPPGPVADLLARRHPGDLALWDYVLEDSDQDLAHHLATAKGARPEALVLAAASMPRKRLKEVSLRRWAAAGRMVHDREDPVAEQAAARLFALGLGGSGETARKLLIDCFGPSHRALEAGTLEPKSRLELEALLPKSNSKSPGKAERLNRALIEDMERHEWSQGDLSRALQPAGPEARRLIKLVGKKHRLRRFIGGSINDVKSLRN